MKAIHERSPSARPQRFGVAALAALVLLGSNRERSFAGWSGRTSPDAGRRVAMAAAAASQDTSRRLGRSGQDTSRRLGRSGQDRGSASNVPSRRPMDADTDDWDDGWGNGPSGQSPSSDERTQASSSSNGYKDARRVQNEWQGSTAADQGRAKERWEEWADDWSRVPDQDDWADPKSWENDDEVNVTEVSAKARARAILRRQLKDKIQLTQVITSAKGPGFLLQILQIAMPLQPLTPVHISAVFKMIRQLLPKFAKRKQELDLRPLQDVFDHTVLCFQRGDMTPKEASMVLNAARCLRSEFYADVDKIFSVAMANMKKLAPGMSPENIGYTLYAIRDMRAKYLVNEEDKMDLSRLFEKRSQPARRTADEEDEDDEDEEHGGRGRTEPLKEKERKRGEALLVIHTLLEVAGEKMHEFEDNHLEMVLKIAATTVKAADTLFIDKLVTHVIERAGRLSEKLAFSIFASFALVMKRVGSFRPDAFEAIARRLQTVKVGAWPAYTLSCLRHALTSARLSPAGVEDSTENRLGSSELATFYGKIEKEVVHRQIPDFQIRASAQGSFFWDFCVTKGIFLRAKKRAPSQRGYVPQKNLNTGKLKANKGIKKTRTPEKPSDVFI